MSAKATAEKRTPGHVGEFYNHLGASLIGGEINGDVHDGSRAQFSDVYNRRLRIFLEAKGAGNGNGWKLATPQLDSFVSNGKSYVYFLGGYKNDRRYKVGEKKPKGIKSSHRAVLPTLKTKREQFAFLASETVEAFVLDISFVQMLKRIGIGKDHEKSAFGHREGLSHFELRRNDVRQFIQPTDERLMELGILPGEWVFRSFSLLKRFIIRSQQGNLFGARTLDYSVEVSFPLHTVLPTAMDGKLCREIERNNDVDLPF